MNLILVGSWKYEVVYILFFTLICSPLSERPASEHLSKQILVLGPGRKFQLLITRVVSPNMLLNNHLINSYPLVWHGLKLSHYLAHPVDFQTLSGIYKEVQLRSSWAGREGTVPPYPSSQVHFHSPTSESSFPQNDHEIEFRIKRSLWSTRPSTMIHCHQIYL